uniref:MFS domain-containing protein n=1 Tax=Parastrongyloides trichosuri TaxID=131310 RepID=A0A0N4ZAN6_PARTI
MNEDKNTEKHTLFKSFHLKEWILLSLLLFSNTISPMTFLCISPFFADVSLSKGLSLTLEGIIFAIFSFCGFLLSPFVGRMIPIFGVRYIYTLGLTLLSLGTLIFSTTNLINSGIWFFITTFILRVLQSMGYTMMYTTTYAIASKDFPTLMSTIIGLSKAGTVQKFACSMILVPSFKQCKDIVTKEHGFVESLQTSAIVSGLYASSYSLGCFFGPFIGSALVEHVGYKESLSLIAALCFVSSMGNTMIFTTTYVIIVKYFPKLISSMLSITENGVGIGYTVGPVIGGSLYEYVGYPYPFLVFGIISSLTTVVAFYCISPHSNEDIMKPDDKENMKNMKHLTWSEVIKIKDIWCIAITLVVVGTALSFHESTLAIGGKEINLSYTEVGILFLAIGGMCSIFSPVWEYITSKYFYLNNYLIILGYVSLTLSFFCMSPLSFIEYKPSIILYGLCLSWMGFASSLLYVPAFRQCMSIITKEHGFAESLETLSILAAIYSLSISVGTCLGPSIGSILVENLGYRKSLSVIAILCFSSVCFIYLNIILSL